MEVGETVKRVARAYLAILVGPSIGSARERVFLAVDAFEARIWGEREDAPSKGENNDGHESDQSEDEEEEGTSEGNEDSEDEDQDNEEEEATSGQDDDKHEHASVGLVATSPSSPQSPKDKQNEAQAAVEEGSEAQERQAQDEDWSNNEATPVLFVTFTCIFLLCSRGAARLITHPPGCAKVGACRCRAGSIPIQNGEVDRFECSLHTTLDG
jgi:hypothetical protein